MKENLKALATREGTFWMFCFALAGVLVLTLARTLLG